MGYLSNLLVVARPEERLDRYFGYIQSEIYSYQL